MRALVLLYILLSFLTLAQAQERCGVKEMDEERSIAFEKWMQKKKAYKLKTQTASGPTEELYQIPVVFHIIHNGEPEGVGENLSEARILDQLDALNEDFQKMNPRASGVPSEFQAVEADIQIQFILARQDQDGLPTNGIIRKQGGKPSYSFPFRDLKEESYWNAENYLNIWVAETGGTIGYASFPETNEITGITGSETNPIYDGVVVDDDFLGTNDMTDGSFDSFGQTLTHEVGHYLGLLHIWGGSSCGNDHCVDTPPAGGHHGNSGSFPVLSPCTFPGPDSCTEDALPDMFMNFMDYTDDECLFMFTEDQKFRMRTVMENSPRRLSLRTSPGLEAPIGVLDLDMAYRSLENPIVVTCNDEFTPLIRFENHGINTVTELQIEYEVNSAVQHEMISGLNLATGEGYVWEFPLSSLSTGTNVISWNVDLVNGETDDFSGNNSGSTNITVDFTTDAAPFRQDFENNTWLVASDVTTPDWVQYISEDEKSLSVQAFGSSSQKNNWLVSPSYSLEHFNEVGLSFDLSYAISSGGLDELEVLALGNCQSDWSSIWNLSLAELNFESSDEAWFPSDSWHRQFISLSNWSGSQEFKLAFVFTNNGGNNFYIDNIELSNNSDPNQPLIPPSQFFVYPNPALESFEVKVNLLKKQNVRVQLIDLSGKTVLEESYSDLLNHTLEFNSSHLFGLYLMRITGQDISHSQRILIGR